MQRGSEIDCTECGNRSSVDARFCEQCGASLRERCPWCAAPIRARQKFCGACGEPLDAEAAQLSRFQTPAHLEKKILPAEGERKIATILFADIVGSTDMIANLDPEAVQHILLPVFEVMKDTVHRYEGTVVRDRGDGIEATFGAPVALEDHALRACYAALDMQAAIGNRSPEHARVHGIPLQVRIGIHTGLIAYTTEYQGGRLYSIRLDGVPVHIAARLEPIAPPGGILLSRDTLALAEGFVRVRDAGPRQLKGILQPVHVYQLEGVITHLRLHVHAQRGLSKFVGRQREIVVLHDAAQRAHAGNGQIVALAGEPGVGKSRLFMEFMRSSAIADWLVLEAGTPSYSKTTAYLPLIDLMNRYFEIEPGDKEPAALHKITHKLSALGDERLLARMPFIVGALGMGLDNTAWAGASPAERQNALFDGLWRLLLRESQKRLLCLLFEDLHWIDTETLAFLDMLVERLPAARMLLLVNYRPELKSRWTRKPVFTELSIAPLAATGMEEMLEALLGTASELNAIKLALSEAAAGNPLYLEENVRGLVETGVLAGEPGCLRVQRDVPAHFVPRSIQALLAARIDCLSPDSKKVLQCAAVIGDDVPQGLLGAAAPLPVAQVAQGLQELQQAGFLYEKALFPEITYSFKHAMTHEVTYGSMLREHKMALHARTALAIVTSAGTRTDEHIERVALHAEQGGLWPMALEYLERAGTKAFTLYANAEAIGYFERALGVLQHLPENDAGLEHAVDLRFKLRNALIPLCELERVGKILDEAEPLLARLGSARRRAQLAAFRCNDHFLAAQQQCAIEVGEAGLQFARECGDHGVEGELLYRIGQSYHLRGDNRRAIAYLEKSLDFTTGHPGQDLFQLSIIPSVVKRTWLSFTLTECGDFRGSLEHAKTALETAERGEHPLSQVLGWLAIGHLLLHKGELDGATGALERGMGLCDQYSLPMWHLRLLSSLGVAYASRGRLGEGLDLTARALERAEQMRVIVDMPMLLVHAGQAALLAHHDHEALQYSNRALSMALEHAAKVPEVWARHLKVCAAWTCLHDHWHESPDELETAIGIAFACGARPLAALCQSLLGEIYGELGDAARMQDYVAASNAYYEETGMRPPVLAPARRGDRQGIL